MSRRSVGGIGVDGPATREPPASDGALKRPAALSWNRDGAARRRIGSRDIARRYLLRDESAHRARRQAENRVQGPRKHDHDLRMPPALAGGHWPRLDQESGLHFRVGPGIPPLDALRARP